MLRAPTCRRHHPKHVLVGVLGLCHDVVLEYHTLSRRIECALSGHEEQLPGAHRGTIGQLLVTVPSRVNGDGHVASGGEVILNQRFGVHEARHEDACSAGINWTEPLPAHAKIASVCATTSPAPMMRPCSSNG